MRKLMAVYCLLAGSCDAATGALLVAAPAFTIRLMRIVELPPEPVYLRWIGVFVGSVGLAYLYPLVLRGKTARIPVVLEMTALVRLSVALFIAVSVGAGALSAPWLSVFFTDFSLALFQLWLLKRISGP